jgi:hypothetical protein
VPKLSAPALLKPLLQPLLRPGRALAKPWRAQGRWFVVGIGSAALLYWNGRLVVSTGAGMGAMLGFYLLQEMGWRATVAEVQNWLQDSLKGVNQRFALAALCGGGVTFSTYLASSIWLESDSPWTATGLILQGAATVGTLGWLLARPRVNPDFAASPTLPTLALLLADLTHADPLKRLIAVRQLPDWVAADSAQRVHVVEYFQVLLSQEGDENVRSATLQSLQQLGAPLSLAAAPVMPPTVPKAVYEPVPVTITDL